MQSELADGDVVVTTSGLRATVVDASYEETIDLEIAAGVVTTWLRAAVRDKVNPEAEETEGSETEPRADPVLGNPQNWQSPGNINPGS
jgi:preprotein translocase subunit YajC